MADREVTIRIKLDPSQLQAGASTVEGSLARIEGQAGKTGGAFGGLQGQIESALPAIGIAGAVALAGQMINLGSDVGQTQSAFGVLTGSIGGARDVMLGAQGAADGMVSNLDLMKISNEALSTQAVTTKGDLERLIGAGSTLGDIFGGGSKEGVELLSASIEKMSTKGLQQLGINISAVKTEFENLKKAGLTDQDAFRMAALDQASASADKLAGSVTNVYDNMKKLDVLGENIKQRLSVELAGTANNAAGIIVQAQTTLSQLETLIDVGLSGGNPNNLSEAERTALGITAKRNQAQATADTYGHSFDDTAMTNQMLLERPIRAQFADDQQLSQQQQNIMAGMSGQRRGGIGGQNLFTDADAALAHAVMLTTQRIYDSVKDAADKAPTIYTADVVGNAKTVAEDAKKWADSVQKGADLMRTASLGDFLGQGVNNRAQADLGGMVIDAAKSGGLEGAGLQALQDAVDKATGAQNEASLTVRDKMVPALEAIRDQFGNSAMIDALNKLTTEIQDAKLNGRDPNLNQTTLGYYGGAGSGGTNYKVKSGDNPSRIAQEMGISVEDVMRMAGITDPTKLQIGTQIGGGGGAMMRIPGQVNNPMIMGGFSGGSTAQGAGVNQGAPPLDLSDTDTHAASIATSMTTVATQTGIAGDAAKTWDTYTGSVQQLLATVGSTDLPSATLAAQDFYKVLGDSKATTTDIQDAFKLLTSNVQHIKVKIDVDAPPWFVAGMSTGAIADQIRNNGGSVPGTRGNG